MNYLAISKYFLIFVMGFILSVNGITIRNIVFYIILTLTFAISEVRYNEGKNDANHAKGEGKQ